MPGHLISGPLSVAVTGQAGDVRLAEGRQHQTDGQHRRRRHSSPGQNGVDQGSPDPAVAVGEGMDRLELCVHHGRLHEWTMSRPVEIGDQVGHQIGNTLRCRRHERGFHWVSARAPDPVLSPAKAMEPRLVRQQCAVQLDNVLHADASDLHELRRGFPHHRHVVGHQSRLCADPTDRLVVPQFSQCHLLRRRRQPLDL
ncbi:hypothetical protein SDC9_108759 [bioreactor metagenome]|uniref:Uncharacterized protein n=1 Tax=bioreactor metagenome TaxID=1076179 RepID=A0A645B8Y9_9ZZZZ